MSFEGGSKIEGFKKPAGYAGAAENTPLDLRFDESGVKIKGEDFVPSVRIDGSRAREGFAAEPLTNNARAEEALHTLEEQMGGTLPTTKHETPIRSSIPRNPDTPVISSQDEVLAARKTFTGEGAAINAAWEDAENNFEMPKGEYGIIHSAWEDAEEIVEVTPEDEERAEAVFSRFKNSIDAVHKAVAPEESPTVANESELKKTEIPAVEVETERVPFTEVIDAPALGIDPVLLSAEGINDFREAIDMLYVQQGQELKGKNIPGSERLVFDKAYDDLVAKAKGVQHLFIEGDFSSRDLQARASELNVAIHSYAGSYESLKEYQAAPEESTESRVVEAKETEGYAASQTESYTESDIENMIVAVDSFDELYAILDTIEQIEFEDVPYTSAHLKAVIEKFRQDMMPIEGIIDVLSLRDVVARLKQREELHDMSAFENSEDAGMSVEELAETEEGFEVEAEASPIEKMQEFATELAAFEKDLEDSKQLMRTDSELDTANYQAALRVQKFKPKAEELRKLTAIENPTEKQVETAQGLVTYLEALRTDIVNKEQADVWKETRKNLAASEENIVAEKQAEVDTENSRREFIEFQAEMRADLQETKNAFMKKLGFLREGVRQFESPKDRVEYNDTLNKIEREFSRTYAQVNAVAETVPQASQDVVEVQKNFAQKYDVLNDHVEALFELDAVVFEDDHEIETVDENIKPAVTIEEAEVADAVEEAERLESRKTELSEIRPPEKETPEAILARELKMLGKKGEDTPAWKGGLFASAAKDMELKRFLAWSGANKENPVKLMIDRMKEQAGAFVPREEEKMTVEQYVQKLAVGIAKAQRVGNVNLREQMLKKAI